VWLLRFQRIYRGFIAAAPAIVHVSNVELQDSLNGMLPAGEKIVLVLEAMGDDKIRVNSSSLNHPLTILPDQAIEIVGIEKKVTVGRVCVAPRVAMVAVQEKVDHLIGPAFASQNFSRRHRCA
jgi:hypothetical protein